MWYKIGLEKFLVLFLVTTVLVCIGFLVMSAELLTDIFGTSVLGSSYVLVTLCLLLVVFSIIIMTMFQVLIHKKTHESSEEREKAMALWTERWSRIFLSDDQSLRADIIQHHDPIAAEALLSIRETLKGESSDKFAQLYVNYGFMQHDFHKLQSSRLPEVHIEALDRLAMLRHKDATPILLNEINHPNEQLRNHALFALARTYGRIEVSNEKLINIFYPIIRKFDLSRGVLEKVFNLLEGQSVVLLDHFIRSEPNIPEKMIDAAFRSIGHSNNPDLADWCIPWLKSYNPEIKAGALRALAQLKHVPPEASQLVLDCLEDEQWFIQVQASNACVGLSCQGVEQALMKYLDHESWWMRFATAKALSERGPAARQLLRWASQHHPDTYARNMASYHISIYRDKDIAAAA